eukprot:Skav208323  [mRNA]  locus=scaffold897:737440:747258:+ [translate_table: standard]
MSGQRPSSIDYSLVNRAATAIQKESDHQKLILTQSARKRYGPFVAFLSCVYAFQMVLCFGMSYLRLAAHHTEEAVKPDTPIETISIVITAHNEHQYMERTLDSILDTTPPDVLMEIIVIDDGSDPPLKLNYEKVHLLRHDERRGLVKSKMEGGNMARADMKLGCRTKWIKPIELLPLAALRIMFLDAHAAWLRRGC